MGSSPVARHSPLCRRTSSGEKGETPCGVSDPSEPADRGANSSPVIGLKIFKTGRAKLLHLANRDEEAISLKYKTLFSC